MTYLKAILAGIIGAALGWGLSAMVAAKAAEMLGMSNFEGAIGFFAFFGVGPIGGLVAGITAIWLVLRKEGHKGLKAISWRLPAVLAAIAALVAGVFFILYETRDSLGTSSSGPPRLDFELKLPAGTTFSGKPSAIRVELSTVKNEMPGLVFDGGGRQEDGRQVLAGSVELYYRSSWRLLEVALDANGPALIFDLKLPSRPGHMKEFGPWRKADFVAEPNGQPKEAGPDEGLELRTRVVYRDQELEEDGAKAD